MPNRILRDWTDSKSINNLPWQAEVLFTRLIMKADDYGNFHGDPLLIKSLLFPRKDGLRSSDIDGWLKELVAARLIRKYLAKDETFLHIVNFNQRLRQKKRIYPEPQEIMDMTADCPPDDSNPPPEEKRREEKRKRREFVPPTLEELTEYVVQNGYPKELGTKIFSYYDVAGWKDSRGNPVNNWKQKLIATWFKDDKPKEKKGIPYADILSAIQNPPTGG